MSKLDSSRNNVVQLGTKPLLLRMCSRSKTIDLIVVSHLTHLR
jgi:hypothetical protein